MLNLVNEKLKIETPVVEIKHFSLKEFNSFHTHSHSQLTRI